MSASAVNRAMETLAPYIRTINLHLRATRSHNGPSEPVMGTARSAVASLIMSLDRRTRNDVIDHLIRDHEAEWLHVCGTRSSTLSQLLNRTPDDVAQEFVEDYSTHIRAIESPFANNSNPSRGQMAGIDAAARLLVRRIAYVPRAVLDSLVGLLRREYHYVMRELERVETSASGFERVAMNTQESAQRHRNVAQIHVNTIRSMVPTAPPDVLQVLAEHIATYFLSATAYNSDPVRMVMSEYPAFASLVRTHQRHLQESARYVGQHLNNRHALTHEAQQQLDRETQRRLEANLAEMQQLALQPRRADFNYIDFTGTLDQPEDQVRRNNILTTQASDSVEDSEDIRNLSERVDRFEAVVRERVASRFQRGDWARIVASSRVCAKVAAPNPPVPNAVIEPGKPMVYIGPVDTVDNVYRNGLLYETVTVGVNSDRTVYGERPMPGYNDGPLLLPCLCRGCNVPHLNSGPFCRDHCGPSVNTEDLAFAERRVDVLRLLKSRPGTSADAIFGMDRTIDILLQYVIDGRSALRRAEEDARLRAQRERERAEAAAVSNKAKELALLQELMAKHGYVATAATPAPIVGERNLEL